MAVVRRTRFLVPVRTSRPSLTSHVTRTGRGGSLTRMKAAALARSYLREAFRAVASVQSGQANELAMGIRWS
jgi:hypothetical protein